MTHSAPRRLLQRHADPAEQRYRAALAVIGDGLGDASMGEPQRAHLSSSSGPLSWLTPQTGRRETRNRLVHDTNRPNGLQGELHCLAARSVNFLIGDTGVAARKVEIGRGAHVDGKKGFFNGFPARRRASWHPVRAL